MKSIANIIHNKTFSLRILDSKGNELYYENEFKYWEKRQYDSNIKEIYYENSTGCIEDDRQ